MNRNQSTYINVEYTFPSVSDADRYLLYTVLLFHASKHLSTCSEKNNLQQSSFDSFRYAPEAQVGGMLSSIQPMLPSVPHTGKKRRFAEAAAASSGQGAKLQASSATRETVEPSEH